MFTSNLDFIQNWNGLPYTDDIIHRYIIKTVLNTYNISVNKINVEVLGKQFNTNVLSRTYDSSFTEEIKNISSSLSSVNDEHIYTITVPKDGNKSYFTTFTFNKK